MKPLQRHLTGREASGIVPPKPAPRLHQQLEVQAPVVGGASHDACQRLAAEPGEAVCQELCPAARRGEERLCRTSFQGGGRIDGRDHQVGRYLLPAPGDARLVRDAQPMRRRKPLQTLRIGDDCGDVVYEHAL